MDISVKHFAKHGYQGRGALRKPMKLRWLAAAVSLVLAAGAAAAQEGGRDAVQKVEKSFGIKVKSSREVAGLVEMVVEGGQIVYALQGGNMILVGELIDVGSKKSLTRERLEEVSRFLPEKEVKSAWTFSSGKGSKTLWVFTDPKCPFCKRLEPELEKLKDVRIVYVPLAYQRSDDVVAGVLCARDKVAAWKRAVAGSDQAMPSNDACQRDVQEIKRFAQEKMISGTPTMVRADGKRLAGYTEAKEIEAFLAQ